MIELLINDFFLNNYGILFGLFLCLIALFLIKVSKISLLSFVLLLGILLNSLILFLNYPSLIVFNEKEYSFNLLKNEVVIKYTLKRILHYKINYEYYFISFPCKEFESPSRSSCINTIIELDNKELL